MGLIGLTTGVEPDRAAARHGTTRRGAGADGGPVAARLLQLQRLAGNAAVAGLAGGAAVQRKACCAGCATGGGCDRTDDADASSPTGGPTRGLSEDTDVPLRGLVLVNDGAPAPAATTPATTITARDVNPKRPSGCGGYQWDIGWQTNGRNGWIVQEIINTEDIKDCHNTAAPSGITPHYWEAWRVDGSGVASPSVRGINDMWSNVEFPDTKGWWATSAHVHWAPVLDPAAGFSRGGAPSSGILQSTTTRPTNLSASLLDRSTRTDWDCCTRAEVDKPDDGTRVA